MVARHWRWLRKWAGGPAGALLLLAFAACEDKPQPAAVAEASGGAGGAGGAGSELDCRGTLVIGDEAPTELTCQRPLINLGSGLSYIIFASDHGFVQLWLPSSEAGRYTTQDCASLFVSQESLPLIAEADRFPEAGLTVELTRDGDRLTGTAQGLFCDYLRDFPGLPDPDIATAGAAGSGNDCRYPVSLSFDVPVDATEAQCDCLTGMGDADWCELSICSGETCSLMRCPQSAAVCAAQ